MRPKTIIPQLISMIKLINSVVLQLYLQHKIFASIVFFLFF